MKKEYCLLACDFSSVDVARTLVSAAPRLVSALLGRISFSLSRRAKLARASVTAHLTCGFPSGHDFFSFWQLANARLPPGDKLKHVPHRRELPPVPLYLAQ